MPRVAIPERWSRCLKRAVLFFANALLLSCASSRNPATGPPGAAPPPPPAKFASAREAEASVLMLEDERRYDAAILEKAAVRPEPVVRERTAHAIGSIGDPQGFALLANLSADGEASVRAAAALGFELLGDARGAATLVVLSRQSEPGVACEAARALARLHLPGGEGALISAYEAAPPSEQVCLLKALASFPVEAAASLSRRIAGESAGDLHRAAVYAFSRNPIPSSAQAIAAALRDPDPDSAALAARALGVLGRPEGLPSLRAALDRSEAGVLSNALNAIEQIEGRSRTPLPGDGVSRIVALSSDANPNVAIPALTALRRFTDDREAIRTLNAQATSGIGRRREVALVSLVRGLGEKSKAKLDLATGSADAGLRAAAAEGLAGLGEEFAAAYRTRLLSDASPRVREIAIDATPADAAHRDALRAMLGDPDPGVRSAAIDRLAETGDAAILGDIRSALAASVRDSIPDAALSAVSAAARFSTEEARAVLTVALSDPRPLVSRFARRELIEVFHAVPSAIPAATFPTGRRLADYELILADADTSRRAVVHTVRGDISIELDGKAAPLTVENFAALAAKKFFDGTTFDRVVPNFVIQGGDPTGTQHGGPGYEIRDEQQASSYERGSVGMALGGPDTGGSQFFVTLSPQAHLDGRYPLFGRVVGGRETAERIEQGDRVISVTVEAGGRP
ncbi:MAG: peptidylprolyl isomerase [Thermoanaerobaculia bacterium]